MESLFNCPGIIQRILIMKLNILAHKKVVNDVTGYGGTVNGVRTGQLRDLINAGLMGQDGNIL